MHDGRGRQGVFAGEARHVYARALLQAAGQVDRLLDAAPVGRPARTVMVNAPAHFAVAGFGRRQIDDAQAGLRRPLFCEQAFAGTGAAEDQFFHPTHFR